MLLPTENEKEAILSHLLAYTDEQNVRLLAARDYGSRARSLADESSDYDVLFLFAQPPADYALGQDSETYTTSIPAADSRLDTEIELHGWNLKRFIGGDGATGSNPTAVEFCVSPEQYYINDAIADQLQAICAETADNFKPYALINHYRSLAASNYGKYIEQNWVREWSHEQFKQYADTPAGQTSVNETTNTLTIGLMGYDEHTIEIPLDEAAAEGMIRRTTRDRTVKRYLNVMQALLKARYIEQEHHAPPMDATQLLRQCANADWLPGVVYAQTGRLIATKKQGDGGTETEKPSVDEWIEDELNRSIDPANHVQRQPGRGLIRREARQLYNTLDWPGVN